MSKTKTPKKAKAESQTKREKLQNRSFDGFSLRRCPVLPVPTPCSRAQRNIINDAYTIIRMMLTHDEYFQINQDRIYEQTGLSWREIRAAINYLDDLNMMASVPAYGDAGFRGAFYRLDLSGNVMRGGLTQHYGCASMKRPKVQPSRRQMREKHRGVRDTGLEDLDTNQCATVPYAPEAPPLHSYNVQPSEKEKEKAPLSPAGETQTFFPETPKAKPQGVMEEAQVPTPQEPSITPVVPVAEDDQEYDENDYDAPMTHEEVLQEGKRSPTWLRCVAAEDRFEYPNVCPEQDSLGLKEFEGESCDMLSYEPVRVIQLQRCAPRHQDALQWFNGTLMGLMLKQCLPVDDQLSPALAATFGKKLRTGALTVGHFVRYWTMVKTHVIEPRRSHDVLHILEQCARVNDIYGADRFEIAVGHLHTFCDKKFCSSVRRHEWTSFLGDTNPELLRAWEPGYLVSGFCKNQIALPIGGSAALGWAARVMAIQHLIGADHIPEASMWLRSVGITRRQVVTWFVESQEGRNNFQAMVRTMTGGFMYLNRLDLHRCFGMSDNEHRGRVWLLANILQLVTDDMNFLTKVGRDMGFNELFPSL